MNIFNTIRRILTWIEYLRLLKKGMIMVLWTIKKILLEIHTKVV